MTRTVKVVHMCKLLLVIQLTLSNIHDVIHSNITATSAQYKFPVPNLITLRTKTTAQIIFMLSPQAPIMGVLTILQSLSYLLWCFRFKPDSNLLYLHGLLQAHSESSSEKNSTHKFPTEEVCNNSNNNNPTGSSSNQCRNSGCPDTVSSDATSFDPSRKRKRMDSDLIQHSEGMYGTSTTVA